MATVSSTMQELGTSMQDITRGRGLMRALILEPEELVRWSLVTYLARWYVIVTADSRTAALSVLDEEPFDALIVSDDLSGPSVQQIVRHARERNPGVRIVRTVADPPAESDSEPRAAYLEKPFELAQLATLLGIRETNADTAAT